MARFTSPDGTGAPGPTGPTGADGADGVGVPTGGNAGQILAKVDGDDYNTVWIDEAPASSFTSVIKHRVKLSQAINKGQAVYVSSADGTNMIVSKASNASETTSSKTMGLIETTGTTNAQVNVITEGLLAGLNTNGASAGDPVWLGTSGDLIFGLSNKPVAPAHLVFIGIVTRANQNNGEIFVRPQNGFEVGELHDVTMTGKQDGYVLSWNATSGLYEFVSAQSKIGAPLTLTQSSNHSSPPLTISSANEQGGGTGWSDMIKLVNSKSGVTNPVKHIRMNSTGGIEIVNNAYSATIFSLTDSGVATSSNLGDTGWTSVTSFNNGFSGTNVAYRRLNNVVYLRGRISGGSAGQGAFFLPEGYRPSTIEIVVPTQQYGTANITYTSVGLDGNVVPAATSTWLSSVSFIA